MISLKTNVDLGGYAATAEQLRQLLGPAGKTEMHDAAATETVELLKTHIRKYAATHHDSANDIGADKRYHTAGPARRTGHLEDAAASVAKGDITAEGGTVTIKSPGFRRAFGPLTINAKDKQLTIPVDPLSYGNRVADLIADGKKIFRPKGRDFLAMTEKRPEGAALIVLYALKDTVTLKHAPDMLPTDEEFKASAREGVLGVVLMRLGKRGAA